MTLISENGRRSTGSKRKSVNPILLGEMMGSTMHRKIGFHLVSAATVVWLLATGNMRTWGSSGITRQDVCLSSLVYYVSGFIKLHHRNNRKHAENRGKGENRPGKLLRRKRGTRRAT